MVARKRFNPLKLGAEIAQDVSGFSRLRPEVFSQNKHSGLYFASTGRKPTVYDVNGMYIKKSRDTRVKTKRAGPKRKKSAKSCSFQKSKSGQQFANPVRLFVNPARMSRPVKSNKWKFSKRKDIRSKQTKNCNEVNDALLNFKLRGVLHQVEKSFQKVHDYEMSRRQYAEKLKILNEMIWTSKDIAVRMLRRQVQQMDRQLRPSTLLYKNDHKETKALISQSISRDMEESCRRSYNKYCCHRFQYNTDYNKRPRKSW